jgi:hypothetical protein
VVMVVASVCEWFVGVCCGECVYVYGVCWGVRCVLLLILCVCVFLCCVVFVFPLFILVSPEVVGGGVVFPKVWGSVHGVSLMW